MNMQWLGTIVMFVTLSGAVPGAVVMAVSSAEWVEVQGGAAGGAPAAPAQVPAAPAAGTGGAAGSQPVAPLPAAPARTKSFLLDNTKKPRVRISWPCSDGTTTTLEGEREYEAPKQASPIGGNLSAYVALGGNRGDLGLGTPGAVDVRVGFYTIDKKKPMFEHIAANASVTIEFEGITFNQPAEARVMTTMQHLTFAGNDRVLGCAADPGLLATYNTMDPDENLRGRMTKRNGRPGVLAGGEVGTGDVGKGKKADEKSRGAMVTYVTDAAGAVHMKAVIPYPLFKHADDPWLTSNPGDFVEPVHFHIEFECAPVGFTGETPRVEKKAAPKPVD